VGLSLRLVLSLESGPVRPGAAVGELDRFIAAVPRALREDDARFETHVLDWVRALKPEDRRALCDGLEAWLTYAEPAHRLFLVILIGAALRDRALIDRTIAMAFRNPPAWAADQYSVLRLSLVDIASRFPDNGLTAYLETLASEFSGATTYQDQNAAARARIALCFLDERVTYESCIAPVVASLRGRTASPLDEVTAFASLLARRR
jgi:hypothetical protein